MVLTRQDKEEITALLADQLNDFKNKVLEEIKSNILSLLKEDIKKLVREEIKEVEKLNSTVAVLQTHVENLKAQNTQLQERCLLSEKKIDELEQYGRRLCLRVTGVPTEENESSDNVLEKVKDLISESGVEIPDSTIDRAHRIGKRNGKHQAIIVRFTTHRHRARFYKARKNIKSGAKIHIDLTKSRFNLLNEAQNFVSNQEDDVFVYADINCRLKVHFRDHSEKFFDSLDELSGYFFN